MSRKKGNASLEDPEYEQPPEVWAKGYQTARSTGNASDAFVIGQRWASDMEPELGIGTIIRVDSKRVTISFQDGACIREYSLASSPLRRIRFKKGDSVRSRDGSALAIESIDERNGLVTYHAAGRDVPETDLSDSIRFTAPLDRLLSGHTDTIGDFRLRLRALDLRNKIDKSPVRGFCGARIDLIPHQLYIAAQAASRHVRRILLADEVGLGKTIEAACVLHRLLACGLAGRCIVCVPQSIVHVWFVELLRKFNLVFRIIDEEYYNAAALQGKNPFLDDQLVLCDSGFLSSDDAAACHAAEAGWDLLIVDEVHHLRPDETPLFRLVQTLSERSRDVLFLTATPYQHGERSHFARLRLLDPSRYADFDAFARESRTHRTVAAVTSKLLDGHDLDNNDKDSLTDLLRTNDDMLKQRIAGVQTGSAVARQRIVADLLDRFGIGRAMFRNTRAVVGGFPKRIVDILPLKAPKSCIENIRDKALDTNDDTIFPRSDDPRLSCLVDILRKYENEKILLICRHKEAVKAIEKAVGRHIKVNIAQFHEDLSLVQRDRNAAWFGEEEGARILLCSEIGSEGRNFQFCHHLFMWDVPPDCELVEQRIGRLDRIGQKQAVVIHIPYSIGSPSDVLVRFFHEGLGIFEAAVPAAQEVFETCRATVDTLAQRASTCDMTWLHDLDVLIGRSRRHAAEVASRLEAGRDRLLELQSYRPHKAATIVNQIRDADNDETLEHFMIDLFRFHGVFAEPLGKRTYKLWSESPLDESFPALRTGRPLVTFDRARALAREDIEFMTADHPSVRNGMDMFLGSEKGNCCCALWKSGTESGLLLDAVFVVECIAPPGLNVERFLPSTPVRIVVDDKLQDRSDACKKPDFENSLQNYQDVSFLEDNDIKTALLPAMLKQALSFAQGAAKRIINEAAEEMHKIVGSESDRITALAEVNSYIRREEIDAIRAEVLKLDTAISDAAPRLDSIRLIVPL